jgi:hypothetical protein
MVRFAPASSQVVALERVGVATSLSLVAVRAVVVPLSTKVPPVMLVVACAPPLPLRVRVEKVLVPTRVRTPTLPLKVMLLLEAI